MGKAYSSAQRVVDEEIAEFGSASQIAKLAAERERVPDLSLYRLLPQFQCVKPLSVSRVMRVHKSWLNSSGELGLRRWAYEDLICTTLHLDYSLVNAQFDCFATSAGRVSILDILCGWVLICSDHPPRKIQAIFGLFDFSRARALTHDECVMLMCCCMRGVCTVKGAPAPGVEGLVWMTDQLFSHASEVEGGVDENGKITHEGLQEWCKVNPSASALLANLDASQARNDAFASRKKDEQKIILEQLAVIEAALDAAGAPTTDRERYLWNPGLSSAAAEAMALSTPGAESPEGASEGVPCIETPEAIDAIPSSGGVELTPGERAAWEADTERLCSVKAGLECALGTEIGGASRGWLQGLARLCGIDMPDSESEEAANDTDDSQPQRTNPMMDTAFVGDAFRWLCQLPPPPHNVIRNRCNESLWNKSRSVVALCHFPVRLLLEKLRNDFLPGALDMLVAFDAWRRRGVDWPRPLRMKAASRRRSSVVQREKSMASRAKALKASGLVSDPSTELSGKALNKTCHKLRASLQVGPPEDPGLCLKGRFMRHEAWLASSPRGGFQRECWREDDGSGPDTPALEDDEGNIVLRGERYYHLIMVIANGSLEAAAENLSAQAEVELPAAYLVLDMGTRLNITDAELDSLALLVSDLLEEATFEEVVLRPIGVSGVHVAPRYGLDGDPSTLRVCIFFSRESTDALLKNGALPRFLNHDSLRLLEECSNEISFELDFGQSLMPSALASEASTWTDFSSTLWKPSEAALRKAAEGVAVVVQPGDNGVRKGDGGGTVGQISENNGRRRRAILRLREPTHELKAVKARRHMIKLAREVESSDAVAREEDQSESVGLPAGVLDQMVTSLYGPDPSKVEKAPIRELTDAGRELLHQAFSRFDEDADGAFSLAEINAMQRALGAMAFSNEEEYLATVLDEKYDHNERGFLTLRGLEEVYTRSDSADDLSADIARLGLGTLVESCRFTLRVAAELGNTEALKNFEREHLGELRTLDVEEKFLSFSGRFLADGNLTFVFDSLRDLLIDTGPVATADLMDVPGALGSRLRAAYKLLATLSDLTGAAVDGASATDDVRGGEEGFSLGGLVGAVQAAVQVRRHGSFTGIKGGLFCCYDMIAEFAVSYR